MSRPKKLKIEVRPLASPSTLRITAKEKNIFICQNCGNKYYDFHYFCPQCLGRIHSSERPQAALRIVAVPEEQEASAAAWMKTLSGNATYEFVKALHHLPFVLFEQSDQAVAEEWNEALHIEAIQCEIFQTVEAPRKRRKYPPLFASNAPLPCYISTTLNELVRQVGTQIQNPAIRVQWAEAVIGGHKIIEFCYKEDRTLRVLFADYLFQIQQKMEENAKELQGPYKEREEAFAPAIRRMQSEFRRMEKEIANVRKTVRQQL